MSAYRRRVFDVDVHHQISLQKHRREQNRYNSRERARLPICICQSKPISDFTRHLRRFRVRQNVMIIQQKSGYFPTVGPCFHRAPRQHSALRHFSPEKFWPSRDSSLRARNVHDKQLLCDRACQSKWRQRTLGTASRHSIGCGRLHRRSSGT